MPSDAIPAAPPWPADRVERRSVASLVPYARNARTHSDAQVAELAASIREWGWTVPVLVDEAGGIIAGHGRVLAAKTLGILEVPVMVAAGWSDAQRRAYVIADNKLAANAGWDEDLLKLELGELKLGGFDVGLTGFAPDALGALFADPAAEPDTGATDADEDEADVLPPPRPAVARVGDLWRLGAHTLLCGDSTDPAAVARLLGGRKATTLITSPPYAQQRDYAGGGGDWDLLMQGVFGAADPHLTDDAQVLVNLGLVHRKNEWMPYWQGWLEWMRGRQWRRFGLYAWDQGPGLPGDWNGRLAPSFELIFHFNRKVRRPAKIIPCVYAGQVMASKGGLRSKDGTVGQWEHAGRGVQAFRIPDSVLRITRHKANGIEIEHPAVFPVKLPEFLLRSYASPGDVVLEPFNGSGTTILAGERVGCHVAAMEMTPGYLDIAIARWLALHPEQPVTLEDGRTYAEVSAERLEPADVAA